MQLIYHSSQKCNLLCSLYFISKFTYLTLSPMCKQETGKVFSLYQTLFETPIPNKKVIPNFEKEVFLPQKNDDSFKKATKLHYFEFMMMNEGS